MKCQVCGTELAEDILFCSQCGSRVIAERKICPTCGRKSQPNEKFCPQCGTRMTENSVPATGRLLMDMKIMAYYSGEPTVRFAKYTGNLKIYDDRIEMKRTFVNVAAAVFGAVGMAVTANKVKKDGAVRVYPMCDVSHVKEERYSGIYHTIVLYMKNGEVHFFVAVNPVSAKITEAVETIGRCIVS